jgi:hypothetical protein
VRPLFLLARPLYKLWHSRRVADVRPWIGRDVCEYSECNVDTMLEELLYRCIDPSKPASDKSTLLDDTLKAVLPLCNKGEGARDIKKHLTDL